MPESWCKQLGFEQIGKEGQSSLHERNPSLSPTNDNAKPKKRRFSLPAMADFCMGLLQHRRWFP
jgi:hypothetical protein